MVNYNNVTAAGVVVNIGENMGLFKKMRPNGEVVYMAIFYGMKNNLKKFIKKANDENDEIRLWNLKEDIGYIDEIDIKIIKIIREKT